jgi:hypothetical protein
LLFQFIEPELFFGDAWQFKLTFRTVQIQAWLKNPGQREA